MKDAVEKAQLWETIMRHRNGFAELISFLLIMATVSFVALTYDLTGRLTHDQNIELAEAVLIGILLIIGIVTVTWRRFAEQEREIAKRIAAEDRARHLANHDHLTGLPNRRHLQGELERLTAAVGMSADRHAVALMDLNGFKKVNDVFGHGIGDEVLAIVADRISRQLRDGDLFARTGGDEFALIMRHIEDEADATARATAIARCLDDPLITSVGQHRISTGIGLAIFPEDGTTPGELLRKADTALYKSKSTGEHCVFFDEEMDREAREREFLQRELVRCMGTDSIVPFYQPIVDLHSGEIRAFEALARWRHPVLGQVDPSRFIPIAEDSGLIKELTDALLAKACSDAVGWPSHVGLSFNISPVLLRDAMLPLRLLSILAKSGLSAHRLELEITENAIVKDLEAARSTLGSLREAGVRVALDDFGTGATSLFHLRSFKFDVIKIDRSFITMMTKENESAQIVKAVLGLAKGLDVEIIAEGVEDQEQRSLLEAQGCREGQGYLFSEAITSAEALALLRSGDAGAELQRGGSSVSG